MWYVLIANFAVVGLFISAWAHADLILMQVAPRARSAIFGTVMGLGAIASMLLSFELQSGVFFDLRATLVGVSGLLGGPIAGLLTGAIVMAYRLSAGGGGAIAGALGIAISTGLGLLGYALLKGRSPSTLATLLFAVIATPLPMVSLFALPTQALSLIHI